MSQKTLSTRCSGSVFTGGESDIRAECESSGVDGSGRLTGLGAGVQAHIAEIVIEARFKEGAYRGWQRPPAAAQRSKTRFDARIEWWRARRLCLSLQTFLVFFLFEDFFIFVPSLAAHFLVLFFFAFRTHPLHLADGGLKRSGLIRIRIGHAHHALGRSIGFALVHVIHRTDAQFGLKQAAGQQALRGAITDRVLQLLDNGQGARRPFCDR
ncbi:MAG: hypothetical protein V3T53_11190 [Phycisphaerales bacterium]